VWKKKYSSHGIGFPQSLGWRHNMKKHKSPPCESGRKSMHPAFIAYTRLKLVPEDVRSPSHRSSDAMRGAIRAKYSR
jgi:hypothetical protein